MDHYGPYLQTGGCEGGMPGWCVGRFLGGRGMRGSGISAAFPYTHPAAHSCVALGRSFNWPGPRFPICQVL